MPKAKSAAKQARSSQRKRLQNHAVKNRIRTGIREFSELVTAKSAEAPAHGRNVVSLLDRAAKNKVLHHNTTRRYKTRILAQITALGAAK